MGVIVLYLQPIEMKCNANESKFFREMFQNERNTLYASVPQEQSESSSQTQRFALFSFCCVRKEIRIHRTVCSTDGMLLIVKIR